MSIHFNNLRTYLYICLFCAARVIIFNGWVFFSFLGKAACKTSLIYREKKMRASGFPTFQITVVALSSERSLGKIAWL